MSERFVCPRLSANVPAPMLMNKDPAAREILENIGYMAIASVSSDGKPWNTPVYFACDEGFNLYWVSAKESAIPPTSRPIRQSSLAFTTLRHRKGLRLACISRQRHASLRMLPKFARHAKASIDALGEFPHLRPNLWAGAPVASTGQYRGRPGPTASDGSRALGSM
jgi:pyridoxamine 5'-phosphate oxidase-like protein